MINKLRVDHRLLHGQVAFTWIKSTGSDCILIASDSVAGDALRMSALRMAAPSNTKIVIKSIEDSIKAIRSGATDKYRLFIIVESIKDASRLTEAIPELKSVNLGGVKVEDGKKQISKAVFVSEEECEILKKMGAQGVALEVQMLPDDAPVDALTLI